MSKRDISELIAAVRSGEIDALVLPTPRGERIFTCVSQEEPYRVLIEAMSEGALTLSPDGTILYCNSAFAQLLGNSLEKVIGSRLPSFVIPPDAAKITLLLDNGSHGPARAEVSLLSRRGQTVPVFISVQPLRNGERDPICAVVTNLTEVVQARQAQLRLAEIVEHSADAIFAISAAGIVQSWNRGAENLLASSASEITGRSILPSVAVDRCEEFLGLLQQVCSGQSAQNIETVLLRPGGARVDVTLTLSPIRDHHGQVTGASAIARDNSAGKRHQRRLQGVLEAAPDAIVVVNHNADIVFVNTQAEILFGYRRSRMIGRPLSLLIPRCVNEFLGNWFQQEHNGRLPGTRHEISAVRADGSEFPAEMSLGAVESEDGTLLCGSVRDTSERHSFQQALREKNAQLQVALNAKEYFLSTMSHELRTPLTAIIGFIGILLMKISGPLNDAQVRQLELIRSSAKHLLAIICDLLDLGRIEAGKAKLQVELVSCLELVHEVSLELSGAIELKSLQFHILPPDSPVNLPTDRRFLRQIIVNLLTNAIKYTDTGSVTVSWRQETHPSEGTVSFRVADTGMGIQKSDLPRLFIGFSRVQNEFGPPREGTGLGLHLSQKLALLLGGRITVESEFGKGSVFTLTLPLSPVDRPPTPPGK